MIPKEVFQKVRRIEITTSRLVTDVFAGQYHSVFKGRGMEFDEVREYQIGDDVRTIDWNVTARTGRPHIKKFVEERELTIMLLVDASRSCQFSTVNELKSKLAAEIAAVLAFSATRNNDKVGMIIFTDRIEKFIPPRKGLRHVLRIIREVLIFKPKGKATDISHALDYLNKIVSRRAVAFMISDFYDSSAQNIGGKPNASSLKQAMTIANKRHDLVAITLNDPREKELPDCGLVELEDAETDEKILVDSSSKAIRRKYQSDALSRLTQRKRMFRLIGVDHINISTDSSYVDDFVKFFMMRKRRML